MKRKHVLVVASLAFLALALAAYFGVRHVSDFPPGMLSGAATVERFIPSAEFLSPTEKQIVAEMNFARANPAQYAAYLEQLRPLYSGKEFKRPGGDAVETAEGVAALDEAIQFLRSATPLAPLEVSKGLCSGARDHARDLLRTNGMGHRGSDGSFVEQRVERYGNWQKEVGENIAYEAASAREAVINMLIDDGSPKRGHRKNIFNPIFGVAGVAVGDPAAPQKTCVVTLAGGFSERPAGVKRL
jgi:uncharacterized protein YkwD